MSPTPLPSLHELFPNLIKPRGDDPKVTSRPITPQLVLGRVNARARSGQHLGPMRPEVTLARLREGLDPERGLPSPKAPSSVYTDDCHGNARPRKHVCHHCGKRFSRPSSLTIHYHTHTGVRPYSCTYPGCLRTFNVSSNMRRHYKNHEFVVKNRPQPQPTVLRPAFYSPPLKPDAYPPPPLQCGFR